MLNFNTNFYGTNTELGSVQTHLINWNCLNVIISKDSYIV
jgi:hypothetical protein